MINKRASEQAETKTDLLEHTKPNKNCSTCDHYNDYICFDCESMQIKDKYFVFAFGKMMILIIFAMIV